VDAVLHFGVTDSCAVGGEGQIARTEEEAAPLPTAPPLIAAIEGFRVVERDYRGRVSSFVQKRLDQPY
jgi:hypothetical protein